MLASLRPWLACAMRPRVRYTIPTGSRAIALEDVMSNRRGFTLIELLIVVVIIGILAAIAIPKFANTKQKAVKASMISDLRNLATAQEAFYADSSSYATTYGTTIATGQLNFAPSQKNTLTINSASNASGWAATMEGIPVCP
jgi:type IV pilus assembly protein PilA